MGRLVLDTQLSSQLTTITSPTELCDERGRVLGRFIPSAEMTSWEPVTPEITEEELDAIEQSNEWVSHEDVIRHLRSLEQ